MLEEGQLVFFKGSDSSGILLELLDNGLARVRSNSGYDEYTVHIDALDDSYIEEVECSIDKKDTSAEVSIEITVPKETDSYTGIYERNGVGYLVKVERIDERY